MIVGRGETEDGQVIILGLSSQNVERLLRRKPIVVRREVHGDGIPDGWKIVLCYGKTETSLVEELRQGGLLDGVNVIQDQNLGRADDR